TGSRDDRMTSRRSARFARCSVAFGSMLALFSARPNAARANGRPAAAFDIAFDDNSPRVFVGNTFGWLVSDDGGVTWRLICEQVLGTANQLVNSAYVSTRAGVLLVSSAKGIV